MPDTRDPLDEFRVGADPDGDGPDGPDGDLFAPPEAGDRLGVSALEALQAKLSVPVEADPCYINVLKRPGITVVCRTDFVQDDRKAWQRRSTKKKRGLGGDEVDEMLFAELVLANTCIGIQVDGVDADDSEGAPLTFAHRQLQAMVGASDTRSCIRALFANDAHVLLASGEVMLGAGFDDDVSSDPTGRA